MNPTWATIIALLSQGNQLITLANTSPAASEYLGQRFLPRDIRPDYNISGGQLEINSVMAGHVGRDSKYPEGSAISLSNFEHKVAKLAQAISLGEEPTVQLQRLLTLVRAGDLQGRTVDAFMSEAGLNLFEKGVVQSLDDTAEYLTMQALTEGVIDWTFNGRRLHVDYKVPAENKVHLAGTDSVYGSTSKLWTTLAQAERKIRGSIGIVMSLETLQGIIDNDANRIQIVSDTWSAQRNIRTVQIRRTQQLQADGSGGFRIASTGDESTSQTLIGYGREGQILDPTSGVGATIGVQMVADNRIAVIGQAGGNELVSVSGTPLPRRRLGYYHVAPTVEGGWRGAALGRWGRLYTPENNPWELRAEGVENGLPVIQNAARLFIITTDA